MRPAAVGFQCPDDVRIGQDSIRAPRTRVAPARTGPSPTNLGHRGDQRRGVSGYGFDSVNGLNEPTASHLLVTGS